MRAPVLDNPLTVSPALPDRLDQEPPKADTDDTPADAPPDFGRCPVCGKPLRPRCRYTGEPKEPPADGSVNGRAKCGGCGVLLQYLGGKNWKVFTDNDLSPEDIESDKMDRLMGYF